MLILRILPVIIAAIAVHPLYCQLDFIKPVKQTHTTLKRHKRLKKPKGIAKWYHNLTARYNAYFIAWQSLYKAQEKVREQANIPQKNKFIFPYPEWEPEYMSSFQDNLNKSIEKCNIGLKLHPFSKWADDCYFIVGMSQWLLWDSTSALDNLRFLIAEYPPEKQPSKFTMQKWSATKKFTHKLRWILMRKGIKHNYRFFEAAIHLGRIYARTNRWGSAESIWSRAYRHPLFPEKLKTKYWAVRALSEAERERFSLALQYIDSALAYCKDKDVKARLYFLQAQIYERIGDPSSAIKSYKQVSSIKTHPELTFEARTRSYSIALEYGIVPKGKLKAVISQELKKEKDPERQAKLLYLLGLIDYNSGNIKSARKNFLQALSLTSNNQLKQNIYLKLFDIALSSKDWIKVNDLLDSLKTTGWQNKDWLSKEQNLEKVADSLRLIRRIDTLLMLAGMTPKERISFLRKLEKTLSKQYHKPKNTNNINRQSVTFPPSRPIPQPQAFRNPRRKLSWYFYNEDLVRRGRKEFERIWGLRELEDFWRYSDKATITEVLPDTVQEKSVSINPYIKALLDDIPESPEKVKMLKTRKIKALLSIAIELYRINFKQDALIILDSLYMLATNTIPASDTSFWVTFYRWQYILATETGRKVLAIKSRKKLEEYLNINIQQIQAKEKFWDSIYLNAYRLYANSQDSLFLLYTAFVDTIQSINMHQIAKLILLRAYVLARNRQNNKALQLLAKLATGWNGEERRYAITAAKYLKAVNNNENTY